MVHSRKSVCWTQCIAQTKLANQPTSGAHIRLATLNLGRQTLRPKVVPEALLQRLLALECDVIALTEFVASPAYLARLNALWSHVMVSETDECATSRWYNEVALLSTRPMTAGMTLPEVPDACARTNHLCVHVDGIEVTGLRAPAYERRAVWYAYRELLSAKLTGDIVIGDLNVDPRRASKKDRVVPRGWSLVTPEGNGPSYRSLRKGDPARVGSRPDSGRSSGYSRRVPAGLFRTVEIGPLSAHRRG